MITHNLQPDGISLETYEVLDVVEIVRNRHGTISTVGYALNHKDAEAMVWGLENFEKRRELLGDPNP